MDRILEVVRDFDATGGASLGLVAWDLCIEEEMIAAQWAQAQALGLLEPGVHDLAHDEQLWRLTIRGRAVLGVAETAVPSG